MFWGVALLLVGSIVILNAVFGWHIPVMRVLLGGFFVYLGLKFIFGTSFQKDWNSGKGVHYERDEATVVFDDATLAPKNADEVKRQYSTVFGKSFVDLSGLPAEASGDTERRIEFNAVFGEMRVQIPAGAKLVPEVNSVLGSVRLPGEATGAVTHTWRIKANAVFGSLEFTRK